MSADDHPARQAKSDPVVAEAARILKGPWISEAQLDLRRRLTRRRRADYRGERRRVTLRLPPDLVGELEAIAGRVGLSVNEAATLILGSYVRRRDRS